MYGKLLLVVILAAFWLVSVELPGVAGSLSLEYVLSQRMSVRVWDDRVLEDGVARMVCRVALSSSFDLSGMLVYLCNGTGTYRYDGQSGVFVLRVVGDVRGELGVVVDQTFISSAPAVLVVVYDEEVEPSAVVASWKAGVVVQSLYVAAVRYGLGGVSVGDGVYRSGVSSALQSRLGLSARFRPVILFPLGYLSPWESYPDGELGNTSGNLLSPLESSVDVALVLGGQPGLVESWAGLGLSDEKLSGLLWASYGFSLLGTGHRTVPSAYGVYPFRIFVANGSGTFEYVPDVHSLSRLRGTDERSGIVAGAGGPDYLKGAPALLIYCWDSEGGAVNASDADSGGRWINLGFGCCLQNLCLSAAVWNVSISDAFHTRSFEAVRVRLADGGLSSVFPMYVVGVGAAARMREDVNGDGVINILDIVIVAKAFGSRPGDWNWNPDADFDGNGLVNILDVFRVAKKFGS